jgi:hypothetical protein
MNKSIQTIFRADFKYYLIKPIAQKITKITNNLNKILKFLKRHTLK